MSVLFRGRRTYGGAGERAGSGFGDDPLSYRYAPVFLGGLGNSVTTGLDVG